MQEKLRTRPETTEEKLWLDFGVGTLVFGYGRIDAEHVEELTGEAPHEEDVLPYLMEFFEVSENQIRNSIGRLARSGQIEYTTKRNQDRLNPRRDCIVKVESGSQEIEA